MTSKKSVAKSCFFGLGILIIANLLLINWKLFLDKSEVSEVSVYEAISRERPAQNLVQPVVSEPEEEECPQPCLEVIAESRPETKQALATPAPTVVPVAAKEVYIPLGRGSTTSLDYAQLTGAEAVVDLNQYPTIETVYFEAFLHLPHGGAAYAKLYNVTDQHDAWHSEVYFEGSGPYRAEASGVVLSSGRKVYRVMLRSVIGSEAVLESARLKLILK